MAGKAPFGPIQKGFFSTAKASQGVATSQERTFPQSFSFEILRSSLEKKVWAPLGLVASATQLSRTFKGSFQSLGNDS